MNLLTLTFALTHAALPVPANASHLVLAQAAGGAIAQSVPAPGAPPTAPATPPTDGSPIPGPPPSPPPSDTTTAPASGTTDGAQPRPAGVPDPTPLVSAGTNSGDVAKPVTQAATDDRDPKEFARFDKLREPGLSTSFPAAIDSITGNTGNWRGFLADHNIGVDPRVVLAVVGNVLDDGQPSEPQRYNGQKLTLQTFATTMTLTAGLGGFGLPNAKFIIGESSVITNYDANGPSTIAFRALAFYNSWLNKQVELKIGWISNYYEFIGLFIGGSPVLASGLSGVIPIAVGLSADPNTAPAVNLRIANKDGIYLKGGAQRSTSVKGTTDEVNINHAGLDFFEDGAHALTIAELGYRKPASKDTKSIWLRGGGMYNFSNYVRFDGKGNDNNGVAFAAADYEPVQFSKTRPHRGVYVGGSAFYAPAIVNVYTQSYEARAFAIGPIDARDSDTITLRFLYSKFSADAEAAYSARKLYTNHDQYQVALGYSMHVLPGVYAIGTAAWLKNPSFIGKFDDGLILSGSLYTQL